jgi:hypothetical protein
MATKKEAYRRGPVLTVFAILFALLAISNLSKPFSGGRAGFVFLGTRTSGLANAILSPAFGIFLLIYAIGIWRQRRFAVPMAWAYAIWVPLNIFLFTMKAPHGWGAVGFGILYTSIAVGVSWASAIILTRRKAQLS